MSAAACKAKGRRLQQAVRDVLRELGRPHGLEDGDIESRGMGQNGEDVILSPAAKRLFNLCIECKNVESLNVVKVFQEHFAKYERDEDSLKLLIHSRNHTVPMVTLRLEDFFGVLELIVSGAASPQRKIGFCAKAR